MQFPLVIEGHQIYEVQKSWQLAKMYECVKGNSDEKARNRSIDSS